jgi:hypothetical protein
MLAAFGRASEWLHGTGYRGCGFSVYHHLKQTNGDLIAQAELWL